MSKNKFTAWAGQFLQAWQELNSDKALSLLDKKVEYYESPFSKPCKSWKEVVNLWKVISNNQKNISYKYDVVMVEKEMGLIHWHLLRTTVPEGKRQVFDGVFLIKLKKRVYVLTSNNGA